MLDSDKLEKAAVNRLLPLLRLEDRILKNLWLVLLASLLAACSSSDNFVTNSFRTWDTQFTDVAELTAQLRSPQVTAVPLNSLLFQMVSVERSNRVNITANSPIVNLPEGNSFVAALLLPERISQFTFVLESLVGRTVFVPHVIFLNENLQEVSRIDDAQYNAKGFLFMQKEFTVELTENIRYILVYSKDSDLEGRTEIVDVAREYELSKGKELPEQSFPKLYTKHSPIGNINISFKDVFFSAQIPTAGSVVDDTKQNKTMTLNTAPIVEPPTILSDTEAFYLQQISKAIKEGNLSRAKSLVEEAERAGSIKAQSHYMKELKKQQQ